MTPLLGILTIVGWHGASTYYVEIYGETPKKLRVRALQPLRLPKVGRKLEVGGTALVPRTVVRIVGGPNELDAYRAGGGPYYAKGVRVNYGKPS